MTAENGQGMVVGAQMWGEWATLRSDSQMWVAEAGRSCLLCLWRGKHDSCDGIARAKAVVCSGSVNATLTHVHHNTHIIK